jgi:transcriptional regulator GlxA family with amidase domain
MPRVVIVVLEGAQTLDVTGPAEVFAAAGRALGRPAYQITFASSGGGRRTLSCALVVDTRDLRTLRPRRDDIVVVAGGDDDPIRRAVGDPALLTWLRRAARIVHRLTSVCSGAFVLAAAGLLDGKRAATHWSACDQLAQLFPRIEVDRNAIYVEAGAIWTSAGVTTGIDMALALVEEAHGAAIADNVAARLVLYMRRPGYQSQWSDALVTQRAGASLAPAIAWARAHLGEADLDAIARRAGMSPRTFHRRCLDQLRTTPAKLLAKLRVERARDLLATSGLPAKSVAAACGFSSAVRMQRAFERELGLGPRAYRLLHPRGELKRVSASARTPRQAPSDRRAPSRRPIARRPARART